MRIAVFDYRVVRNNPIGGCHRRMLSALCRVHDFTVFAVEFDNPCPERIRFVRVPAIRRPLALLFITYHLLAPICYLLHRIRTRRRLDLIQMVESNLTFGDLCYSHFCHRKYLASHASEIVGKGLVHRLRMLDHRLHALLEPWIYRRVSHVIVPSEGLARELKEVYPFVAGKIQVLPNPVDVEKMQRPADFDRVPLRLSLGLAGDDLVVAFAALGHFERKGLPQLLEAIRQLDAPKLKLLVVGGSESVLAAYRSDCRKMGLENRVVFAGMQTDVRPFLWASDAFVLPSFYETFSLVTFEAAAAALPVVVTPLNGVEEFLENGFNGILVDATPVGIGQGLRRLLESTPELLHQIGLRTAQSVRRFDADAFIHRWESVYAS